MLNNENAWNLEEATEAGAEGVLPTTQSKDEGGEGEHTTNGEPKSRQAKRLGGEFKGQLNLATTDSTIHCVKDIAAQDKVHEPRVAKLSLSELTKESFDWGRLRIWLVDEKVQGSGSRFSRTWKQ